MDIGAVKGRLQEHFSDGLVIIIGSGLSCAEGLPGMGELADYLCEQIVGHLNCDDAAEWEEILPMVKSEGLEAAFFKKPPSPNIENIVAQLTGELISLEERAVISDVFLGNRQLRLTRLMQHILKPKSGIPIVTTNYDRLIEVAVEEAGVGADTMFVGRFAGALNETESRLSFCRKVTLKRRNVVYTYKPRALVYKPHGSLDWYLRDSRPVSYPGDLPDATRLIITPGKNKFRNGYDSPFDVHRARANEAIDRASRFLIIGYGFNDDHLETHLTPAINEGVPTLIVTYKLSPLAESLAKENNSVIALDRVEENGRCGTRIIVDGEEGYFPGLSIWDINSFVEEVLGA